MSRIERAIVDYILEHGESSSYDVCAHLRQLGFWFVFGRAYPALHRLEDRGVLDSWDGPPVPERGGRPRRYYKMRLSS